MASATLSFSSKTQRCGYVLRLFLLGDMGLVTASARAQPVRARKTVSTIRRCFRENWGAPFIIGFMLLLMVAAASLSVGLDSLANGVAMYAYCALAIGVVLQLVRLLKNEEKDGCEDR